MKNLLPYCRSVDARSEKDLPVCSMYLKRNHKKKVKKNYVHRYFETNIKIGKYCLDLRIYLNNIFFWLKDMLVVILRKKIGAFNRLKYNPQRNYASKK
jgi:hypothetical protein